MKFIAVSVAAVLALFLTGCEEFITNVSTGVRGEGIGTRPLQVGDYVPDFKICDKSGQTVRFSRIRGDVTILAIMGATDPGTCVILDSLRELAVRRSSSDVDVQYVSVSQPANAKPDPNAKIVECPDVKFWHVIGLYDESAKVKSLYGAKASGTYFIIDDDSRIAGMGDVNDLQGLQKDLDKPIRKANMDNCIWNEL